MNREGWVELITGPMFAGKTEEFVKRVNDLTRRRQFVRVYRPPTDDRTGEVVSHSGHRLRRSEFLSESYVDDLDALPTDRVTVAFEEAQFFPPRIVSWVDAASQRGTRVIIAGLDRDYRGAPFGSMKELLFLADDVKKLSGVCVVCCRDATRTQRKDPQGPTVVVGAGDLYEPRCKLCHRF